MPVHDIDGFALSESSAIDEYRKIGSRHQSGAYYLSSMIAKARARARQIECVATQRFAPIRAERSTDVVFAGVKKPALSTEGAQSAQKLIDTATSLWPTVTRTCLANGVLPIPTRADAEPLILNGDDVPSCWWITPLSSGGNVRRCSAMWHPLR
ncbi:hypothetical protein KIF59_07850 [Enterobacter cloacae subsp. cloacae]|nr:hypothetical protein [Enterobacter cloacae subsp. cloacae]